FYQSCWVPPLAFAAISVIVRCTCWRCSTTCCVAFLRLSCMGTPLVCRGQNTSCSALFVSGHYVIDWSRMKDAHCSICGDMLPVTAGFSLGRDNFLPAFRLCDRCGTSLEPALQKVETLAAVQRG